MNGADNAEPEHRRFTPNWGGVVYWLSLVVAVYLFSTGPVTHFWPRAADAIYAPLAPVARNRMFFPIVKGWLSIWGVKFPTTSFPPTTIPPVKARPKS